MRGIKFVCPQTFFGPYPLFHHLVEDYYISNSRVIYKVIIRINILCLYACTLIMGERGPSYQAVTWNEKWKWVQYGLVRFGTVWYSLVRFGTVWYGLVRFSTYWYGLIRFEIILVWFGTGWFSYIIGLGWYGLDRFDTDWNALVQLVSFGTVWYGLVRFGTVWYGLLHIGTVWYSLVRYITYWYGLIQLNTFWYRFVKVGTVILLALVCTFWYGLVRFDTVWNIFGIVWYRLV